MENKEELISQITKDMMESYEQIRLSGKYNMLMEAGQVMTEMKMNPRHKKDQKIYLVLLENYQSLMNKFGLK